MIFVALQEAAQAGTLLLVDGGLCRFHQHKRLPVVTIREILVLPDRQRQGIGRQLFAEVLRRSHGRVIRAKCPVKYLSGNAFWASMGFTLVETVEDVNLWQRPANP